MNMFNQEKYNEELKKAFEENMVEFEVPVVWYDLALRALEHASPIALGIKADEMLEIYNLLAHKKPLNYFQYALVSNNLESRSAVDFGMDFKIYAEHMMFVGELTAKWNEATKPIQAVIFQRVAKPVKN